MAKTKTPFLSLGSSGTVGGVLTSQKRGSATLLREKPVPTDPYSLAQAYQRWDYKDYAYLWTLLSNSEKQLYRSRGSRYHITGFSQWMREKLKDLPDLLGRWHLDERSGTLVHDSSKNNSNGTIIGASPATGLIAGAYYFDGINDLISIDNPATFNQTDVLYIELFVKVHEFDNISGIISRRLQFVDNLWYVRTQLPSQFRFDIYTGGVVKSVVSTIARALDTWYHLVCVYDRVSLRIYVDGVLDCVPLVQAGPLDTGLSPIHIGRYWWSGYNAEITADEVSIRNEVLPIALMKRHAERRYPA